MYISLSIYIYVKKKLHLQLKDSLSLSLSLLLYGSFSRNDRSRTIEDRIGPKTVTSPPPSDPTPLPKKIQYDGSFSLKMSTNNKTILELIQIKFILDSDLQTIKKGKNI